MLWGSASLVHGFMAYKIWQLHGFFGFSGSTHAFASAYRLKSKSRRCKKNTFDMLRLSLPLPTLTLARSRQGSSRFAFRVCRIQGTGLPAQKQSKKIEERIMDQSENMKVSKFNTQALYGSSFLLQIM